LFGDKVYFAKNCWRSLLHVLHLAYETLADFVLWFDLAVEIDLSSQK